MIEKFDVFRIGEEQMMVSPPCLRLVHDLFTTCSRAPVWELTVLQTPACVVLRRSLDSQCVPWRETA